MDERTWWKNFALGSELGIAGTFIYNGLRTLHSVRRFGNETASFEILYNLSVGIERLEKVAIVLLEYRPTEDLQKLEESLKGHSTHALAERIDRLRPLGLAPIHKEFLSLLSNFYNNHRYARYSLGSMRSMGDEHKAFVAFIVKHANVEPPEVPDLLALENNDQSRRFVGKVLKRIVEPLYEVVRERAEALRIFTYELASDTKAGKVFLDERLDFIDEEIVRREILLHLLDPSNESDHIKDIRGFPALPLDPGLDPDFIEYLLDETPYGFSQVGGEVEVAFEDHVDDVKSRFTMLRLLDQTIHWADERDDGE